MALVLRVGGVVLFVVSQARRARAEGLLREAATLYEAAVRSEDDLRAELESTDVNRQDSEGDSALHMAYYSGQAEAVARLKALGADEYVRNNEGLTPEEMRDVAATEALLERTTACMTLSHWIDEARGRVLYDELRACSPRIYNPALVRLFMRERHRQRLVCLAVKVGIPDSKERLALILGIHFAGREGRGIANIFLNSGSHELADAARRWALRNGYDIHSRVSGTVARWGEF
ncbi:hypothetical protein ACIBBB_29665 [Streptomyces sp. NPDC051217]|uniref:hypothetical protein n=1 Tax=Streptomyces sp. NPDC051217 TaxID=3365644 RepID=UPI0037A82345